MDSLRFSPYLILSLLAHGVIGAFCITYQMPYSSEQRVILVDIIHNGVLAPESSSVAQSTHSTVIKPTIPSKPVYTLKHTKITTQTQSSAGSNVIQNQNLGSGALSSDVRATYEQLVMLRLEERKRYPRLARRLHAEGISTIEIAIDPSGHLISKKIVKSSGHEVLDQEVLELAERAAPYPAIPDGVANHSIQFEIPIAFKLV